MTITQLIYAIIFMYLLDKITGALWIHYHTKRRKIKPKVFFSQVKDKDLERYIRFANKKQKNHYD